MATDYKFEGWAGLDKESSNGKMVWQEFEPKQWEEGDVDIKISHSGICGTDLHNLRDDWGVTPYPCVVGHEIVGTVVRAGSQVSHIKVGDVVGIGAQADSCLNRDASHCQPCADGEEPYCAGRVNTYANPHRNGDMAFGGFASYHRGPAAFAFKIPEGIKLEHAAPMMCGGVTMYAPLKAMGAGPGKKVGIVGVGGLGHFAVLLAKAMGADEVVGISRRAAKRDEALRLGCDDYIATEDDEDWVAKNKGRLDIIVSSISSSPMPFTSYLTLLKTGGKIAQLGIPPGGINFDAYTLATGKKSILGTIIGNREEIREMLELAAEKKVEPWVEMRPMRDANQTMVDFVDGKARFRYVLVNE